VEDVLKEYSRIYTWQELQQPPEEVDKSKLETSLSALAFEDHLGMTKQEFWSLPIWKREEIKKHSGLYW